MQTQDEKYNGWSNYETWVGHALGAFDPDVPNVAAVASCGRCDELASVDLSEAPYLFGHAMDRPCGVAA